MLPPAAALPAAEQRRAGHLVRLALALGFEAAARAGFEPASLRSVFSSSGSDGQICHDLCRVLASADRQLSPTAFHNSVHNAAAGYWGIASGSGAASTALCAFDASFAAGLLEALTQVTVEPAPLLFVAYDAGYPEPLHAQRPLSDACGLALLLLPAGDAARRGTIATLSAVLSREPPQRLRDPQLERLRVSVPAARGLPLLRALARRESARVRLEYLDMSSLAVEVAVCD